MPLSPGSAISAFTRRVGASAFLAGALQMLGGLAIVGGGTLLWLRGAGSYQAPNVWWSLLLLPVLSAGWWRWQRDRMRPVDAAAHLDRRLELGGLLLAAHDGVELEPAWQRLLEQRLVDTRSVLPVPRWGRIGGWPLAAALLALGIVLLPPPAPPVALPPSFAATEVLERLQDRLQELTAQQVPPEIKKELAQQLEQLQQRAAAGDPMLWRDLDELTQRLSREQLLAAASAAAQGAAALAAAIDGEQLAKAAAALAAAGGLDQLPAAARALLQQAMDGAGGIDPSKLPIDKAALQELAKAMAGAVEQLAAAAGAGAGAAGLPKQLADLRQMLAAAGQGGGEGPGRGAGGKVGNGAGSGEGQGVGADDSGSGAGTGGVGRGPGYAALQLTQDSAGQAEQGLVLPPGAAVPDQWVPVGSSIAEPSVQPRANTGAGGAGAAGRGGASWQLQLAPRHRQVVQRFFPSGDAATGNEDKR